MNKIYQGYQKMKWRYRVNADSGQHYTIVQFP